MTRHGWTSSGVVEFRKDIYGRDGVLQVASTR